MKLLSGNLLYCLRLGVPSYFWLFTIEFRNLQNPSIMFWIAIQEINTQQKLFLNNIQKRRKQKQKNPCFNWIFDNSTCPGWFWSSAGALSDSGAKLNIHGTNGDEVFSYFEPVSECFQIWLGKL